MNQKHLFPLLTLAIGASTGYLIGKGNKNPSEESEGVEKILSASSKNRPADSQANQGKAKPSARSLANTQDILQLPGQLARMQSLLDFYSSLSPDQLAKEAKKLDSIPMPERIMASYLLFAKWAETDPYSALDHSSKMGFAGMFARPSILQSWASVDPSAAAKYFDANNGEFSMMGMFGGGRGGPMGNGGASIIAGEWARQNPELAMEWAKKLQGNESGNAISAIVSQVAISDPEKAIHLAATLTGEEKTRANREIAESLGAKDWSTAEKFINGLPSDQQSSARERAFEGLAKENAREALHQINSFTDEDQRTRATARVAEELSKTEPQEAFTLVMTHSANDENALRNVMMNWSRQDHTGALQAINGIQPGEMRDTAISTYVFSNRGAEYAENLTLAESITDEGTRERAINVSLARWMTKDSEAAKAAVKNSTVVSEEMKKRVEQGNIWGGRGGVGRFDRRSGEN